LKTATIGGRNMYEPYDVYSVINAHIFISTCWFYSHNFYNLFHTKFKMTSCRRPTCPYVSSTKQHTVHYWQNLLWEISKSSRRIGPIWTLL